jgi:glycerol kinase
MNKKNKNQTNKLVGAIDQGTSSSRFLVGFYLNK